MNVNILITLAGVIFASITAPLLIQRMNQRQHREDLQAEWDRQDQVAAKAEQVANQAKEAARLLSSRQDEVAAKAAEAAKLLLAANERVASSATVMENKLDVIHGLVNSSMTAEMERALQANEALLATLVEVRRLNTEAGRGPSTDAEGVIRSTERAIGELRSSLADRETAAEKIQQDTKPLSTGG